MFLEVFSVRFWLESSKICKNMATFFIFTFFADILCFFSPGRDQLLGRAGQKNIGPVSALYMSFGWQGWTALFDLVDTAGPKV